MDGWMDGWIFVAQNATKVLAPGSLIDTSLLRVGHYPQ